MGDPSSKQEEERSDVVPLEQIFASLRIQVQREATSEEGGSQPGFPDRLTKHKILKNIDLLNKLRNVFNLKPQLNSYPDSPYDETELPKTSEDYTKASFAFKNSNKPFFTISKITKVNNMFHELQYKIMKDKYQNCYGEYPLYEKLMFHGTKTAFLNGICTYNFDRSKVLNHKFGYGISFAKDAFYATHYHQDNKRNRQKVMVIAQVLYGTVVPSTSCTIVPGGSCYTSANANVSVVVKYDDASFYPLYIVYYEGLHPKNPNRRGIPVFDLDFFDLDAMF